MTVSEVLAEVGIGSAQEAVDRLNKLVGSRGGIPTYLDIRMTDILRGAPLSAVDVRMLRYYVHSVWGSPARFCTWEQREEELGKGSFDTELDMRTMVYSQGAVEPYQWRGRHCFKTFYELALYPMMLAEVAPGAIIELGAGVGGSSEWFADMTRALDLDCIVHAVDLQAVDHPHGRIRTYRQDCIEWVAEKSAVRDEFASPLIVVEDFHGDLHQILGALDDFLRPGDYLVIEDALPKQESMAAALKGRPYLIDTRYTDFFGLNCTSAMNGILKRI